MNPLWVSIAIGAIWSAGNVVWSVLLMRIENKLLNKFVTKADCLRRHGDLVAVQEP
jgi:hypothetical protein